MVTRTVTAGQLAALLPREPLEAPAYAALADRIRLLVIDGRLVGDQRLPSERELALALTLSRTTVTAAYTRLRDLGVVRARRGSGNYVAPPARPSASGFLPGAIRAAPGQIGWNCASGAATAGLTAAYGRAATRLPELLSGSGYLPDGLDELRERLAAWYVERGLDTDPAQIVVTTGALSALNVVLRSVLERGDRVLLESPTYPNAIEATRRAGLRPVAYPLPPDGLVPREVGRALDQTGARAAYLIPEFQNPTGRSLSEPDRLALAAELHRRPVTTVVDETLVELALDDPPRGTPLAALLPGAVTLGSASKAFWGGLRVGWIRAPRAIVPRLVETRAALDLGTAPFEQLVLAELLADPVTALTTQRDRIRRQRDHLEGLVRAALPEVTWRRPAGGLGLWLQLPEPVSSRLAEHAEDRGLVITPGHRFFVDGGGERCLRVPFTHDTALLDEAMTRLADAFPAALAAGPLTRRRRADRRTIELSA